jgi:hypothetical protein
VEVIVGITVALLALSYKISTAVKEKQKREAQAEEEKRFNDGQL